MPFDSRVTYGGPQEEEDNNDNSENNKFHYLPWGSGMYNVAYAIHLGPSITVAPFTHLGNAGLAAIRLQGYFTVGYRASLLWMNDKKSQDVNVKGTESFEKDAFDDVDNSNKLSIGHGVITSWGIRLNWKRIGIGFESVKGNYKYQSLEKSIYGSKKYKFTDTSRRITLSYIW